MIIKRGMTLIGAGLFLGFGAALGLTRLLKTLLYGVKPTDSATFGGAVLALAVVALFACVIPASRASRIDPASALRNE
jgi:ABC-type antimicrobial peptide transport system permease subunit